VLFIVHYFNLLAIFKYPVWLFCRMEESPGEHKKKHHKDVQDLWEEIEKRDKNSVREHHDVKHRDYEEEALSEDSEEEKEEE